MEEEKIVLTDELLKIFLSRHFHYEVAMLLHCASRLIEIKDMLVNNKTIHSFFRHENLESLVNNKEEYLERLTKHKHVYLESFVNHSRTLIIFFFTVKKSTQHPNDALAQDFFPKSDDWFNLRGEETIAIRNFRTRASVEVMHLTFNRKFDEDPTKVWSLKIVPEIFKVVQLFIKNVPQKYRSQKLNEILNIKLIENYFQ